MNIIGLTTTRMILPFSFISSMISADFRAGLDLRSSAGLLKSSSAVSSSEASNIVSILMASA